MRIPFWQRDHAHPTKTIDRLQSHRSFRRIVGLTVSNDYSKVIASLVLVRGTGKHSRFKVLGDQESKIDDSVIELIQELNGGDLSNCSTPLLSDAQTSSSPRPTLDRTKTPLESDFRFAAIELSCALAGCFRNLISNSGTNKDDIVAIGVMDPGIQINDFDGNHYVRSLIDSTELAHRSSTTIIDRFRERDIADGGQGEPLFPLGYWFLLADRNPKVSEENRLLLLNRAESVVAVFLPASDGLDATLPQIRYSKFVKSQFTAQTLASLLEESSPPGSDLALRIIAEDDLLSMITPWLSTLTPPHPLSKPEIAWSNLAEFGIQRNTIEAVATAFMANAFIDQLPVSLPSLTGNPNPRVLGSLTPGSLVNFRNFVLETSKVTPSIMKLRDVI